MSELKHVYPLPGIMRKAWRLARHGARRFGGRARQYLPESLRQAWAEAKATAARVADQTARVLASIASLPADMAAAEASWRRTCELIGETAEERFERRRAEREAVVVPFPTRRPSMPASPIRRAA